MILELEEIVLQNLRIDAPQWTGNLFRHITATGLGKIVVSGPSYDIMDAEKKVSQFGRGNARRLITSWEGKKLLTSKPYIGVFTGNMKQFFDYAMLLNEYGAFGGGRHKYWTNRSVVNACNLYAEQLKSKGYDVVVDNRLPL